MLLNVTTILQWFAEPKKALSFIALSYTELTLSLKE